MEIKGLRNRFKEVFGAPPAEAFFAPGRINLIGEHTDYNGGHVFPAALTMGTTLLLSPRSDHRAFFYSANFEHLKTIQVDVLKPSQSKEQGWVNYFTGVLSALAEKSLVPAHGFDVLVYGNIPNGAGLSSSAALEVVFATALNSIFKFGLSPLDCALIGQRAEHIFGVNCGIMDQFASAMGKKNQALFLDCATLKFQYVPVELGTYTLMIMDSRKKHSLGDSKYNERRNQCEEALKILQTKLSVKSLGEMSEEQFTASQNMLPELLRRRAKHAVTENARTLKSLEALREGKLEEFGELINQSHYSMRDDYEVSCAETDALTDAARSFPGVLGSRMTGGGFGGSCIALVPKSAEKEFIKTVSSQYKNQTGLEGHFYQSQIGDGARKI